MNRKERCQTPAGTLARAALLLALLGSVGGVGGMGCKSRPDPPGTLNVTLINMNDQTATGVVLEFDRRIEEVVPEGRGGFQTVRLEDPTSWSVLLTGGALEERQSVSYLVTAAEGAPKLVRGRWIRGRGDGPVLQRDEVRLRYPKDWPGGHPREKLE